MSNKRKDTAWAHKQLLNFLGSELYNEFLGHKRSAELGGHLEVFDRYYVPINLMIKQAFPWGNTPQGFKFWYNHSMGWQNYLYPYGVLYAGEQVYIKR